MSLWKQINTCAPEVVEKIKQYYSEKGLGEIRGYLAPWIEERILSEINLPSSPEAYEQRARKFQEDLKKQLVCSELLVKTFKVLDLAQITSAPHVELYSHVRNGLQKEFQMIEQMQNSSYMSLGNAVNSGFGPGVGMPYMGMSAANIMGNAMPGLMSNMSNMGAVGGMQYGGMDSSNSGISSEHVQWLIHEIDCLMQITSCFKNELDMFQQYYANFRQNRVHMENQQAQQTELAISERANTLSLQSKKIINDLRRNTDEYCKLQETVINQLKTWQHHQALAGNGATHKDNLDFIQRCVEMLMDFLEKLIDIVNVKLSTKFDGVMEVTEQLKRLRHSQEMLIASAFIVEKQPPQVMKTNTKFAAGVRWLIGNRLGVSSTRPQVECHILSEAQAKTYSQQCNLNNTIPQSSGEITSHCVTMDYTEATGTFFATFKSMSLKKIRRAEKKGTESVMDEKFTLLFKTSCLVNGYQITVWTISLPVVVIVHGNQEPQSWATITWDNAFAEIGREPFQVPEKVSWNLLAATLNTKFASVAQLGLTEENLRYMRDKLFCNEIATTSQVDQKDYITWAQFCKDHLRGRNFTFWDWFYAIIKLTKDHFLGLWRAGLIYGFIDKARTVDILSSQQSGTFLLRFSDSTMGGISVAFVDDSRQVWMLEPWIAKDLTILGLADRLRDIQALRYLYNSNMTRDEAFKEFYTQRIEEPPTKGSGYVGSFITVNVPGMDGRSQQATPQHQMQSPQHQQDMQVSEEDFEFLVANDLSSDFHNFMDGLMN